MCTVSSQQTTVRDFPGAIAALRRSIELQSATLSFLQSFQGMLGNAGQSEEVPEVPKTLGGRILLIAKSLKRPLMPKDFAEEYERRGWPLPEGKKSLNDALSSRISELHQNHKLKRVESGYVYVPIDERPTD